MDFFFLVEAPVAGGWPLLEFFVVGVPVPFVASVSAANCFLSCPSSEFRFFVLAATPLRTISSNNSVSTLVSASRRSFVASVASSRVLVERSFFREMSTLMASARSK